MMTYLRNGADEWWLGVGCDRDIPDPVACLYKYDRDVLIRICDGLDCEYKLKLLCSPAGVLRGSGCTPLARCWPGPQRRWHACKRGNVQVYWYDFIHVLFILHSLRCFCQMFVPWRTKSTNYSIWCKRNRIFRIAPCTASLKRALHPNQEDQIVGKWCSASKPRRSNLGQMTNHGLKVVFGQSWE